MKPAFPLRLFEGSGDVIYKAKTSAFLLYSCALRHSGCATAMNTVPGFVG